MADFHQNGVVATLHDLGRHDRPRLEEELRAFALRRPLALVLPCLASDLDAPPMRRIIEELAGADYVNEVVLALGRASKGEVAKARQMLAGAGRPALVVHNGGRRVGKLLSELEEQGISAGPPGKGRGVWTAMGVVLARGVSRVVAVHDSDIVDYDRLLLGRLAYPVMNPSLGYEFCKGFYARVTHRMFGRVTRLFVAPFLLACRQVLGPLEPLRYLAGFRYPLAGEFAMELDLARACRLRGDWGLEVGVLLEALRHSNPRRICQVDLGASYDHKHQDLDAAHGDRGLLKMSVQVGRALLRGLAAQGVVLSPHVMAAVQAAFPRQAEDLIAAYAADAALAGLTYDRHAEGQAVEAFTQSLAEAVRQHFADPVGNGEISNWNRVTNAGGDFLDRLLEAVEADNA